MSGSIFEFFRKPVNLYRSLSGSYVNGFWTGETFELIPITASVQPIKGEELQLVPEGRRDTKMFKFYTSTFVRPLTSENPDQIELIDFPGERYEVIQIFPWQNNSNFSIVNHFKFIALLINYIPPSMGT